MLDALQKWFGHTAFREGQEAPIRAILAGEDAVVIMPTGSGKSLCYQLAAMLLPHTTLVISPLIALMKDQVDALEKRNIPATYLNSSVPPDEMAGRLSALAHGRYKLVYIAPERFRNRRFMERLAETPISLLTVDEAHCISQWGHDFRPDYLNLKQVVTRFPNLRVMAVTATATPDVRQDIIHQLGLGEGNRRPPFIQVQGFARPNLHLTVSRCRTHDEKLRHVNTLVTRHKTGIVYVATRNQAERVYQKLLAKSFDRHGESQIFCYHGALSDEERARIQDAFMEAEHPVVVATNAFGMGVDRADIRFVAHWDVPGSIEAYYQEVGRAGRDGHPSFCDLLFNYADVRTQRFFIDGANPTRADADTLWRRLQKDCAEAPQRISTDEWAERAYLKNPMAVRTLLGIFEGAGFITREQEPGQRICTTALVPDPDPAKLDELFALREQKAQRDNARLNAVLRYVDYPGCRHAFILSYFGERMPPGGCGGCDHCGRREALPPLTEEQWIILQKALSCVGRMRGQYGIRRVIQVLRADPDPLLAEKGLTALSTYGLLKSYPAGFLNRLFTALTVSGCLAVTDDDYRQVSLTPKGHRVVQRQEPDFTLPWPDGQSLGDLPLVPPKKRARNAAPEKHAADHAPSPAPGQPDDPDPLPATPDLTLFAQLKAWRKRIADAHRFPVYRVMSNNTLLELARRRPETLDEMRAVKGIGPLNLAKYGEQLLRIIAGEEE